MVEAMLLVAGVANIGARAALGDWLGETRGRVDELPRPRGALLVVPMALNPALSGGTADEVARLGRRALGGALEQRDRAGPLRHPAPVEMHLWSSYRKLGITGRDGLTAALAGP